MLSNCLSYNHKQLYAATLVTFRCFMVKLQYLFSIARPNASDPIEVKENPAAIWTVGR